MVFKLFRNLSPLPCNTAAVRWIRRAALAIRASPVTEGEDLSPQPGHGAEKSHTAALHPSVANAEEVWGGEIWPPSVPARGPRYFCFARSELDVPWWWTGTTGVAGIFAYVNCNVKVFVPAALTSSGGNSNDRIRIYLCCAGDVTCSYFQPCCHGNHQASAPVSSSIYNLLILFHLSD